VAKLQVYKFVNPGTVGKAGPEVTAARKQTLAFNRVGGTISSIGNIVSDIEKISIAQIKDDRVRAQAERRRQRRELDSAAEDAAEQKKLAKQKPNFGGAAKKIAKGSLSWIEKFLGPIGQFLLKLGTLAITTSVLKWVGDPQNREKLKTFLEKTQFVFSKLFGWAAGFTNNVLDGFSALTDPNADFGQKLGALGTMMKGIIGLKYLMNPFSLITDILGIIDLLGKFRPGRKPRKPNTPQGRRTAKGTTLSPDGKSPRSTNVNVKPTSSFTGIENTNLNSSQRRLADNISKQHGSGARSVFDQRYNQMVADGASPSQAARRANADVAKLLKSGKLTSKPALGSLSPSANRAQGLGGSKIFKYGGKNIDKATQRFFLKVAGKGGVKSLKKLAKAIKVPIVGALITAIINWMAGDSVLDAVFKGLGLAIGELLGGWAGGAIGALGGPAAPITVPLGAFVGSVLGGIGGEALGGWLAGIVSGKGNPDGIKLGAIGSKLKEVWDEKIMNGEFWAGAWQTFLNVGGKIMTDAWQAVNSMASFALGQASNFFTMLMEKSEPWRNAMMEAFNKYILNGPMEMVKTIFDTIMAGARGIGQLFTEGAPILLQMIKETAQAAFDWVFGKVATLFQAVRDNLLNPWGAISALLDFINPLKIPERIGEMMGAVGQKVSKTVAEGFAKAKEIGGAIIEPVMQYIQPALTAIDETWKIVSNLPGWVYNNSIKPIFDAVTGVFNSGPAIWEWLNKENTFQEITGQAVPGQEPQGMFLGGVVKGIKKAVGGVGKAVSGVMNSPVGQVLGTAASFIPGAAPIMAGINTLATGNPMSMLGMIPGVSGMMGSVGNAIGGFMSGPLGNIAGNIMSGNFMSAATTGLGMLNPGLGQMAGSLLSGGINPMGIASNLADQFGMSGIFNAVTGAMGGDYTSALGQIGAELGVDPKVLGAVQSTSETALKEGGISAQYAMQQTMEFIPVPMIMEKLVPIPQAVPINNGGGVVNAVPSSLQTRMR